MYGYLYCENGDLERLLDDVGYVPSLNFNIENLFFSLWNLTCMICAYVHMHLALRAQLLACMHKPRVSVAFYFPKIIYLLIKSYIFHFNIP